VKRVRRIDNDVVVLRVKAVLDLLHLLANPGRRENRVSLGIMSKKVGTAQHY
jgi:hypothetical protein